MSRPPASPTPDVVVAALRTVNVLAPAYWVARYGDGTLVEQLRPHRPPLRGSDLDRAQVRALLVYGLPGQGEATEVCVRPGVPPDEVVIRRTTRRRVFPIHGGVEVLERRIGFRYGDQWDGIRWLPQGCWRGTAWPWA